MLLKYLITPNIKKNGKNFNQVMILRCNQYTLLRFH